MGPEVQLAGESTRRSAMERQLQIVNEHLERLLRMQEYTQARLNLVAVKVTSLEELKRAQLQRPHEVVLHLLECLQDVDEDRMEREMESVVARQHLEWTTARKVEGRSYAEQRLSWKLLCREIVLKQDQDMVYDAMQWVEVVYRDMEKSSEEKQVNLQRFEQGLENNLETWRRLRRTDVQFWEPAGEEELQRPVRSAMVEVMQSRVKAMKMELDLMEVRWMEEFEPRVGGGYEVVQGEMELFRRWMQGQVC